MACADKLRPMSSLGSGKNIMRIGCKEATVHCVVSTGNMLAQKTSHSIFLPDLVLAALLPEGYPQWKRCVQTESLQWLVRCTQHFFDNPRCAGCIVNVENHLLHEREVNDSRQLTQWACGLVRARVCNAKSLDSLFSDVAVTVLSNVAFRGADENMCAFLEGLRSEFEVVLRTVQLNPTWFKHEAVKAINSFEHTKLPRSARCISARVLRRCPVLFGGMVYACAFALAFLRLMWMDRKTLMLMKLGVVPSFRGAVPRAQHR